MDELTIIINIAVVLGCILGFILGRITQNPKGDSE
jgi:hypothetical protein